MRTTRLFLLLQISLFALHVQATDPPVDHEAINKINQDFIDRDEDPHPVLVKGDPEFKESDFHIEAGMVVPKKGKGTSSFDGLSDYTSGRGDWDEILEQERIKRVNKLSFHPLTKTRVERQKSRDNDPTSKPILTLEADGGTPVLDEDGNQRFDRHNKPMFLGRGHVSIVPTRPHPIGAVQSAINDLRSDSGFFRASTAGAQQPHGQPENATPAVHPAAEPAPENQQPQPAGESAGTGACITKRDGSSSCSRRSRSTISKSKSATTPKRKALLKSAAKSRKLSISKQGDLKTARGSAKKSPTLRTAARKQNLKTKISKSGRSSKNGVNKAKSPKASKAGRPKSRRLSVNKKAVRKTASVRSASRRKSTATSAARKHAAKSKSPKAVASRKTGAARTKGQVPKSAVKKQPRSKKAATRPKRVVPSKKKPAPSRKSGSSREPVTKPPVRKAALKKAPVARKGRKIGRRDVVMNRPRLVYEALYERDLVDLE